MTVHNLIKQLEEFDSKAEVVMGVEYPSGDPELVSVQAIRYKAAGHIAGGIFHPDKSSSIDVTRLGRPDVDLVLIEVAE